MPERASSPRCSRRTGLLAGPPSSPFTVYESHCPTPSREQVPICPGPTCFFSLLPMASLPCFLLLACQKDAGHCAVQLWGPLRTQSTPVPWHWAGPVQEPSGGQNLFVLLPYNDCQTLSYRKQNRTNKSLPGPDGASQVLTFY